MIDVFKVGVHIGMTSNASSVLSVMLREMAGVHIAAGKLEKSLVSIRTAALGAGAVFAGWSVVSGIWRAIENSRELNKELEKTKQLGGDFASRLGETRAAAFQTARDAPTSIVSDNVRMAREIGVTLGHPDGAREMLTEATKAAYVISHFTGESAEDITKNLMRTADARAQIYTMGADGKEHVDPARLTAELNAAAKGLILGGGFISSRDMLQEARQASVVAKGQTAEAFYAAGTEAAIAMGASRLGTAETSLMQQFIGGTMTKKVAEHMEEAGLLHAGEWHSGGSGGVVVNPSVAARFEPMMKDPIAWLSTGAGGEAVRAYAAKEGISVIGAIMQLFGRQTTQRLVSEAMSNEPQFARARQIFGNIPSVQAQYKELQANDLDTNIKSVSAAWKSFAEAFSDAATPLVIPILHGLTQAIHVLMDGAGNHPLITEGLIGLAVGISSLTALGGALAVLNLCWAPLASGLRMLIGTTSGLVALGDGLSAVAIGLTRIGSPVAAFLAVMKPSTTNAGEDDFLRQHRAPDGTLMEHPSSPFVAPPSSDGTGQRSGDVYLDKKKVGMIMNDHTADRLSRAQTGSSGVDYRVSPMMPGMAFG